MNLNTKIIVSFCLNIISFVSFSNFLEKNSYSTEDRSTTTIKKSHPCDIAKSITVKIIGLNVSGSGIIIKKKASKYFVLTSAHLLMSGEKEFRIQTPDDNIYSTSIIQRFDKKKNKLKSNDLATFQFKSRNNYPTARLSKSFVSLNQKIFVAGFSTENKLNKKEEKTEFTCDLNGGIVNLILPKSMKEGYQIGYNIDLPRGMSGGPLIDAKGEIQGINGKHRNPIMIGTSKNYVYRDNSKIDCSLEKLTSVSWAIPIQAFLEKPTTSDSKPITSDLKPITPDSKPTTSDLKPITPDSKPTTSDLKPITPDSKPITSDSKPTTSDLKPITPDSKPITSDSKPITSDSKPTTSDLKPITPDSKPITPDSKPITPDSKPITPKLYSDCPSP